MSQNKSPQLSHEEVWLSVSSSPPAGMLPDQIKRIRTDLSVLQTNMTIFSDMMTELFPGRGSPDDKSLLEQLHGNCRSMQSRMVELMDQVDDESLTADLLEINDNMNNLFLR